MDAVIADDPSILWAEQSEGARSPAGDASAPAPLSKSHGRLHILAVDILFTSLRHMLPNALSWFYRSFWTRQITCFKVESDRTTISKTANLFLHGSLRPQAKNSSVVLLLHGDHSHPFSLLHLADIAQAEGKTVFSVHLPYDDDNNETHHSLLRQSIEKIQQLIQENGGSLTELIAAGHSRGAIKPRTQRTLKKPPEITKVISLASRLKVIRELDQTLQT